MTDSTPTCPRCCAPFLDYCYINAGSSMGGGTRYQCGTGVVRSTGAIDDGIACRLIASLRAEVAELRAAIQPYGLRAIRQHCDDAVVARVETALRIREGGA